jgi:hypothetical protein
MKARVRADCPQFSVRSAGEIWVKGDWREVSAGIEAEIRSNDLLETDEVQTQPEPETQPPATLTKLVVPVNKRGKSLQGGR